MVSSTSSMLGATGRRKTSSPNKPTSNSTKKQTPSRPSSPRRTSKPTTATRPSNTNTTKPARKQSDNRHRHQMSMSMDDSDSDLTPQSSDNDEDDDSMQIEQDLTPKRSKKNEPTPRSNDRKGKGKEKAHEPVNINGAIANGPRGRERKRNTKLEEVERRRARDAKFDDSNLASSSTRPLYKSTDFDDASSFGDDESDHGVNPLAHQADQDDMMIGVPDSFAGQGIEDLAYGAGPEFELEATTLGIDWWGDSDDETEEDEEGIYIDHLSGSEAERQSVSTSHDSEAIMSDEDDFSSSSEEEQFDAYGLPMNLPGSAVPAETERPDRPFIVMQNWKGELELVHTRPARSRTRKERGSTSRTAGSVGDSTVVSNEPELRIDPDEDSDASSWSGLSDEDEDGGNTTDSMDEDDMPMLDSPALQQLMGTQIGLNDLESLPSPVELIGPSIIVTDTSLPLDPDTPALSTSSSNTNVPVNAVAPAAPLTPGSATPAVALPQMGTFHPVIDDPAQCAVIDGSKSATKSPFTHKRRNARGRKGSVTSSRSSLPERKRKPSMDLFSPHAQSNIHLDKLHKQARYSSIPGHPRYVKAKRAEALEDGEKTTSESEEEVMMSLEDMIETSVLEYESANDEQLHHHSMRFDRVPVSTYMRRNILSSAGRADRALHDGMESDPSHAYSSFRMRQPFSSPVGRGYGMTDTLVGPISGRGLVMSPVLAPVREGDESRPMSRKEKRRTARLGNGPIAPPPLQL